MHNHHTNYTTHTRSHNLHNHIPNACNRVCISVMLKGLIYTALSSLNLEDFELVCHLGIMIRVCSCLCILFMLPVLDHSFLTFKLFSSLFVKSWVLNIEDSVKIIFNCLTECLLPFAMLRDMIYSWPTSRTASSSRAQKTPFYWKPSFNQHTSFVKWVIDSTTLAVFI